MRIVLLVDVFLMYLWEEVNPISFYSTVLTTLNSLCLLIIFPIFPLLPSLSMITTSIFLYSDDCFYFVIHIHLI